MLLVYKYVQYISYTHLNVNLGFVISRVDALYVPITDRFRCLMSIDQSRKPSKTNTLFSHFKDNTLHTIQKLESKTCNHALKRFCTDNALPIYKLMKWKDGL